MAQCASSFRWESDLSSSFQRYTQPSLWSRNNGNCCAMVFESRCSEGRADLVWACAPNGWPSNSLCEVAGVFQKPTCSRILALLKPRAIRSEEFLLARTGVNRETLRRCIRQTEDAGLAFDLGNRRFVLGARFLIPEVEICAFEFKLRKWRRALYQAVRYRTFSHRVYVVLPPESLPQSDYLDVFRRFNVGLLSHDRYGHSTVIVRSQKQSPTSRYRLIMALGMLLHQVG